MEKIEKIISITIDCNNDDVSVRRAIIYMDNGQEVGRQESNNRYSPSLPFRKQALLDDLSDRPNEQKFFDELWTEEFMAAHARDEEV